MIGKRDNSRHSSTVAFLDFLFNLVLSFVMLVILLLMIVKLEASKPSVQNKNEFVLTVQWDDGADDDVDTWVQDPRGKVISYRFKEVPGMHLQRDDLGRVNKTILDHTGRPREEQANQEVVNFTSWIEGQYNVNLHLYRPGGDGTGIVHVTVKLMKVNPYSEAATVKLELPRSERGGEWTALNFHVTDDGKISQVTQLPVEFVYSTPYSVPTE